MEYRKEKHYIVAQEGDKTWKWDFLTNTFIGVKGQVLRSTAAPFTLKVMDQGIMNTNLQNAYLLIRQNVSSHQPFIPQCGKRLEEVVSVGLDIAMSWRTYNFLATDTTKLNKECVNFINEHYNGVYSSDSIRAYKIRKTFNNIFIKYPEHEVWLQNVFNNTSDIDADFVGSMAERGIHEKVFAIYSGSSFGHLVNEWYRMSTNIGEKPEAKHNILTNYAILNWLHEEREKAHLNDTIKTNNDLAWLYYSTDEYIIRPLLSTEDFHKEAEAQHNCVERMYMNRVANGTTHVVVVRKKSDPDASFITCEVTNDRRINQYLYKFNQHVHFDDPLSDLRDEYQRHLYSSLSNEP